MNHVRGISICESDDRAVGTGIGRDIAAQIRPPAHGQAPVGSGRQRLLEDLGDGVGNIHGGVLAPGDQNRHRDIGFALETVAVLSFAGSGIADRQDVDGRQLRVAEGYDPARIHGHGIKARFRAVL